MIAALRDRDGHHVHAGFRQDPLRPRRIPRPVRKIDVRADHLEFDLPGRRDGLEYIALGSVRVTGKVTGVGRTQVDCGDPPSQIAGVLHVAVDVDRLVGTVECAESQVHDTGAAPGPVIGRALQPMRRSRIHRTTLPEPAREEASSRRATLLYSVGVIPFILRNCRLKLARFWKPAW